MGHLRNIFTAITARAFQSQVFPDREAEVLVAPLHGFRLGSRPVCRQVRGPAQGQAPGLLEGQVGRAGLRATTRVKGADSAAGLSPDLFPRAPIFNTPKRN